MTIKMLMEQLPIPTQMTQEPPILIKMFKPTNILLILFSVQPVFLSLDYFVFGKASDQLQLLLKLLLNSLFKLLLLCQFHLSLLQELLYGCWPGLLDLFIFIQLEHMLKNLILLWDKSLMIIKHFMNSGFIFSSDFGIMLSFQL